MLFRVPEISGGGGEGNYVIFSPVNNLINMFIIYLE